MKQLPQYRCNRCGHRWTPEIVNPVSCPKCHSPYWNRPRKLPRKEAAK